MHRENVDETNRKCDFEATALIIIAKTRDGTDLTRKLNAISFLYPVLQSR